MRQQPEMLSNGSPNITIFRTSRARQVTYNPAERNTEPVIRPRRRPDKYIFAGLVGIVLILGILLFWQQTAVPWWTSIQDQWQYGTARVTQLDANVGHGGTGHFLAEYDDHEIVIMEISLTNSNDFHVYTLTGMVGANDTPVILLSVADINQDGKPDLIVQVKGSTFTSILNNNGQTFQQGGM